MQLLIYPTVLRAFARYTFLLLFLLRSHVNAYCDLLRSREIYYEEDSLLREN